MQYREPMIDAKIGSVPGASGLKYLVTSAKVQSLIGTFTLATYPFLGNPAMSAYDWLKLPSIS